jgi:hypothetical protein
MEIEKTNKCLNSSIILIYNNIVDDVWNFTQSDEK